jgi:protoporphyrinogen oxidase
MPENSVAIEKHVIVIGAGFTGLSAAYRLSESGVRVTLIESAPDVGGLASSFDVGDTKLERFYHHWFTSDRFIFELIEDLGLEENVVTRPTNTGMYFANQRYRLTSPFDLLKFTPLPLVDRIRLGLLVLKARREQDWHKLDRISAADWIKQLAGENVYKIVWEPLLKGKFGRHADQISASWFWAKLVLRGGSRGKGSKENLAYYRGGFASLADKIVAKIRENGGEILVNSPVLEITTADGRISEVVTDEQRISADAVVATPALPIIDSMINKSIPESFSEKIRGVEYLANVCLVLILDRSLSSLYWTNVNDPSFPFVGVIEHTNFEPPSVYGGGHIVYLSKYLADDDPLYKMSKDEVLAFSIPHIKRMFEDFDESWIKDHHVWRDKFAQPIVSCGYKDKIPASDTPIDGLYIATMAQVYPEDRGTNYAVREGKRICTRVLEELGK